MTLETTLDPTGGEPGADTQPTAGVETETTPKPVATRTYSDADMAGLRRSEQARYDRQLAIERERIRQELQSQYTGDQDASWKARVEQELLRSTQARFAYEADSAIAQMKTKYADFEPNAEEIGKILTEEGIDRVPHYSAAQMLDLAYRIFDQRRRAAQPPVDVEKAKKEAADAAVKAYIEGLKGKSSQTPRAPGQGGAAPVSSDSAEKRRTRKGAFEAALEQVTKSKQS